VLIADESGHNSVCFHFHNDRVPEVPVLGTTILADENENFIRCQQVAEFLNSLAA